MKKVLVALTIFVGMSAAYAQYGSSNNSYDSYSQYGQQRQQQQAQQVPQQQQQQGIVPSDCSHLSQQEQQFASQLSDMHRTMFCRHFSVSQRIEAMTLSDSGAQGLSGSKAEISPDEAVEVVLKSARQSQPEQEGQQQQQGRYGGSYNYPSKNGKSSSSKSPYSNY